MDKLVKEFDSKLSLLIEVIQDMTLLAGGMLNMELIDYDDSRVLFQDIKEWAQEFEDRWGHVKWDETNVSYFEAVDKFAEVKLLDNYGVDKEKERFVDTTEKLLVELEMEVF